MKNWKEHRPESFDMRNGHVQNWFSNMIIHPIVIDGITYMSTENYFQAQKSLDKEDHLCIANLTPSQSKRAGRKLILRPDWEEVKYSVMKTGLRTKFLHPAWNAVLLATGDEVIIEWNNWNDRIWGVSITDNMGQNLLGKALMEIRDELRQ